MIRRASYLAVVVSLPLACLTATAQPTRNCSPVTDARLESPEARSWLMFLREYNSWSDSPLKQITARSVANLTPVWTMSTGMAEGHQSPPIVNDGVMFVTTPYNQVLATARAARRRSCRRAA